VIDRVALGIDIGGTKVAAVLVDSAGTVLARERGPVAPESNEAALASIFAVSDRLFDTYGRDRTQLAGIGAGAPGGIDWRRGVLTGATNLAWQDLPLGQALSERYGVPAVVDNDVNVAAWGERCFGGWPVPIQHLVFITVGTGIGAGLIESGRIVRGRRGAGEIGHIPLLENGPRCKCGLVGCLEAVASGPALGALGCQLAAGGSPTLLALAGGNAKAVTAEHVFAAAQQGDTGAQWLLERQGYYLALCVLISWRMLDPDVVVIGGGMAEAGPPLFEALWSALRRLRPDRSWGQQIGGTDARRDPSEYAVPTRLGADAGAVGAAALVLQPEAGFVEEGIISLPSR
jgi:glucokinase